MVGTVPGSNKVIDVFREQVRSTGGHVSTAPSLNRSLAPSRGHITVLPACILV